MRECFTDDSGPGAKETRDPHEAVNILIDDFDNANVATATGLDEDEEVGPDVDQEDKGECQEAPDSYRGYFFVNEDWWEGAG
jgi:hypothetical protein